MGSRAQAVASLEDPQRRTPAKPATLLRAALSVAVLALVISRVDLPAVAEALRSLDPAWLLAAVASVYGAILVSVAKWSMLLRSRGHALATRRLTRHYLVGLFFNNFLPTSVGGDAVRAYDVGRDLNDIPEGAASVIAERLIAAVGLAVTAAVGLAFVDGGRAASVAVAVIAAASLGLSGLFFVPGFSERVVSSAMGGRLERAADSIGRTTKATGELLRAPATVLAVLGMSVAFQVLVALVNWCLFRALGSPCPLGACVVYTSVVSAVTMVPVSISGHGVREAGYAYFFSLAGVAPSLAVTASLLFFTVVAACTLPGGLFFALGRGRRR